LFTRPYADPGSGMLEEYFQNLAFEASGGKKRENDKPCKQEFNGTPSTLVERQQGKHQRGEEQKREEFKPRLQRFGFG